MKPVCTLLLAALVAAAGILPTLSLAPARADDGGVDLQGDTLFDRAWIDEPAAFCRLPCHMVEPVAG